MNNSFFLNVVKDNYGGGGEGSVRKIFMLQNFIFLDDFLDFENSIRQTNDGKFLKLKQKSFTEFPNEHKYIKIGIYLANSFLIFPLK